MTERRPIHVFAGPSLFGFARPADMIWHAPAAAGDLLALADGPLGTIVLIDGLFATARAPWHKEILILLARGFRVIGAASMGALRAAELDGFGMIGCGAIYQAYARGQLFADDAVALLHAPPALGSTPLTLAEVEIRATLLRLVRARRMSIGMARRLRHETIATHYTLRDRRWAMALWQAHGAPGAAPDPAAPGLKQADAMAALAMARADAAGIAYPMPPLSPFLGTLRPPIR